MRNWQHENNNGNSTSAIYFFAVVSFVGFHGAETDVMFWRVDSMG